MGHGHRRLPVLRHALWVNAAFPAFAESLPLVGGFFESFNGKNFSTVASQKTAHGAFLDTYDVQDVNVTAGSADGTID